MVQYDVATREQLLQADVETTSTCTLHDQDMIIEYENSTCVLSSSTVGAEVNLSPGSFQARGFTVKAGFAVVVLLLAVSEFTAAAEPSAEEAADLGCGRGLGAQPLDFAKAALHQYSYGFKQFARRMACSSAVPISAKVPLTKFQVTK